MVLATCSITAKDTFVVLVFSFVILFQTGDWTVELNMFIMERERDIYIYIYVGKYLYNIYKTGRSL